MDLLKIKGCGPRLIDVFGRILGELRKPFLDIKPFLVCVLAKLDRRVAPVKSMRRIVNVMSCVEENVINVSRQYRNVWKGKRGNMRMYVYERIEVFITIHHCDQS